MEQEFAEMVEMAGLLMLHIEDEFPPDEMLPWCEVCGESGSHTHTLAEVIPYVRYCFAPPHPEDWRGEYPWASEATSPAGWRAPEEWEVA